MSWIQFKQHTGRHVTPNGHTIQTLKSIRFCSH